MTPYDPTFYDYINKGSITSAEVIVPIVSSVLSINSVVDFGCGQGAWLRQWKKSGVLDIFGVDGDYVDENALLIEKTEFSALDLSSEINLGRKFDLVQSLEVAEHLSELSADTFIENLIRHGDVILFSAAPVGQGGHDHINEQPYEYWRDKFLKQDYILIDWLRNVIHDSSEVEAWYRYNCFIYVRRSSASLLDKELLNYQIPETASIVDISPPAYKLRKLIISFLPLWACYLLSQIKIYLVLLTRKLRTIN